MRVPGLRSTRRAYRWLRSRILGKALILGYHRIAEAARDPYSICVGPRNFAQHLEILSKVARPIDLQRLVEGNRRVWACAWHDRVEEVSRRDDQNPYYCQNCD